MPREKRALAAEVMAAPKIMLASATRLTGATSSKPKNKTKQVKSEEWQRRAWEWFDEIPEYRMAVTWMGSMLSKGVLFPTKDGQPTTDEHAVKAMQLLFGGEQGQAEMLRGLAIQFTVAGEAYLIGEDNGDELGDQWYVVASTEITRNGDTWKMGKRELKNPLIIRLWRPHPRTYTDPDAPSRPVLPILAELDGLTKHVAAQIDSRLAGAGMLLFPEEATLGTTVASTTNEEGETTTAPITGVDKILQDLMQAMMTAIQNREDASALVPIIAQGPGEYLDKIRHLTFASTLDAEARELRNEAIRRLALGMDLPPEILTGTGDVNHWGAWQIDETSVKAHAEPMLAIICSSLAVGYLRPYLEEQGLSTEEAMAYGIGADTAKMRLRPNRSKEAIELYDRGELSAAAMLRENGFDPEDAMDEDERRLQLTRKLAGGTTTPEAVVEALRLLGVNLSPPVIQVNEKAPSEDPPARRSLDEHPERNPPDPDDAAAAAADVLIFRALERAGNRLKNKRREEVMTATTSGVPASELYLHTELSITDIGELLEDAWAHCYRFCPIPQATLNLYTVAIMNARKRHSRELLIEFLQDPRVGSIEV